MTVPAEEVRFGTAGIRGPVGEGPGLLGATTVRSLALAVATWLGGRRPGSEPWVLVGGDARRRSAEFVELAAETLAAAGCRVGVLRAPSPTPVLAVATRALSADAGLMVTASHNPATDNGVKVYADDGVLVSDHDAATIARLMAEEPTDGVRRGPGPRAAAVRAVEADARRAYVGHLAGLHRPRPCAMHVAATALHGTGGELLSVVLPRFLPGAELSPVPSQWDPDPDFPTAPSPNPELPGVLDALVDRSVEVGADVGVALDPDADRLAVVLPRRGGVRPLTGDELGALLCVDLLDDARAVPQRFVASTLVSSRLVRSICTARGVRHVETPTGFKHLARHGVDHPDEHQVLAYEEAMGYAVGPTTRDKDGISAAVAAVRAVEGLHRRGLDVDDLLDDLARRHGAHVTRNGVARGADALALAGRAEELAARPPARIAGRRVVEVDTPATSTTRVLLEDGTRAVVRPSGTEPVAKYYVEAVEPVGPGGDVDAARSRAAGRAAAVVAELTGSDGEGT